MATIIFTEILLDAIRDHGILAVILGVAVETIIVPLPSPLILMSAGAVLIGNKAFIPSLLDITFISVVAGIAQTIGSYFLYGIAYYGGKPFIDRFGRFFAISWKEIKTFQKKFARGRREDTTLFLLRALPIMPLSLISGVAGVIHMPFRRYTIATFLGTIPRNFVLVLLGWQLTEVYLTLAKRLDHIETIVSILIIFAIILYILSQKFGIIDAIRRRIL